MVNRYSRHRSRNRLTGEYGYNYAVPATGQKRVGSNKFFLFEECFDRTNPGFQNSLGYANVGGPLNLVQRGYLSTTGGATTQVYNATAGTAALTPGFITGAPSQALPAPMTDGELWSQGARAIAESSPSNPAFSLPVFLGELREGVPKLIGHHLLRDQVSLARRSGREYLNYEFGWKPLIQDLKDAGKLIAHSSEIRAQYIRDSGRAVKRRWQGPSVSSSSTFTGGGVAWLGPSEIGVTCTGTRSYSVVDNLWFEGAFRYFIPSGSSDGERWDRWNMLGRRMAGLSTSSTPETVWNLAPWSWLVDWHGDVGKVMTNIGNLGGDGQQLTYGYVMQSSQRITTMSQVVVDNGFPALKGATCGYTYTNSVKKRQAASPFGFGLGEVDYTPRQLAILAALGLTAGDGSNKR